MLRFWLVIIAAWLIGGLAGARGQTKQTTPAKIEDAGLIAWVDGRIKERTPPAEERRFDEIGWAKDIRAALGLAQEHGRPVFLFSHDGRMNLGRC